MQAKPHEEFEGCIGKQCQRLLDFAADGEPSGAVFEMKGS